MKRLRTILEWGSSLAGLFLLFGPHAWQAINRITTLALLVTVTVVGVIFGVSILIAILRSQLEPPYETRTKI